MTKVFHALRAGSPIAAAGQPMLNHREDNGGSNWEPGAARGSSLGLQSLIDDPTLENGVTGVSQIPVTVSL